MIKAKRIHKLLEIYQQQIESQLEYELELHEHYGIRNDFLQNNLVMFFFAVVGYVKAAGINSRRVAHDIHFIVVCLSTGNRKLNFPFLHCEQTATDVLDREAI